MMLTVALAFCSSFPSKASCPFCTRPNIELTYSGCEDLPEASEPELKDWSWLIALFNIDCKSVLYPGAILRNSSYYTILYI